MPETPEGWESGVLTPPRDQSYEIVWTGDRYAPRCDETGLIGTYAPRAIRCTKPSGHEGPHRA